MPDGPSLRSVAPMPRHMLEHSHGAQSCEIAYAAWSGYDSPLRHRHAVASCAIGGHRIFWLVEASDADAALRQTAGVAGGAHGPQRSQRRDDPVNTGVGVPSVGPRRWRCREHDAISGSGIMLCRLKERRRVRRGSARGECWYPAPEAHGSKRRGCG
jgi:hypothetical protein